MSHIAMKSLIAAVVCLSLSHTVPALAQQQPDSARIAQLKAQMVERFRQADANSDGRVTKAEAAGKMPRLHANFEAVDGDRNGYVTPEEIVAQVQSLAAQRR
jgi:Ca2+-binding EF-hand superfamily protein